MAGSTVVATAVVDVVTVVVVEVVDGASGLGIDGLTADDEHETTKSAIRGTRSRARRRIIEDETTEPHK
ncbi:MAG: hypothetical protein PVG83_08855 [Acidimicrobiia bacterium]